MFICHSAESKVFSSGIYHCLFVSALIALYVYGHQLNCFYLLCSAFENNFVFFLFLQFLCLWHSLLFAYICINSSVWKCSLNDWWFVLLCFAFKIHTFVPITAPLLSLHPMLLLIKVYRGGIEESTPFVFEDKPIFLSINFILRNKLSYLQLYFLDNEYGVQNKLWVLVTWIHTSLPFWLVLWLQPHIWCSLQVWEQLLTWTLIIFLFALIHM